MADDIKSQMDNVMGRLQDYDQGWKNVQDWLSDVFSLNNFNKTATQGLKDYNSALTGYDENGQPVDQIDRAQTLLGNAMPASVAGVAGKALSQTDKALETGAAHADVPGDWDDWAYRTPEIAPRSTSDLYLKPGGRAVYGLNDAGRKKYALNDATSYDPDTLTAVLNGLDHMAGETHLPIDALGMRGKLNIVGDVPNMEEETAMSPLAAGEYQPASSTIAISNVGPQHSLAHEFAHALDNYFGRYFSPGSSTEAEGEHVGRIGDNLYSAEHLASHDEPAKMRPALRDKWETLMDVISDPRFRADSQVADDFYNHGTPYYDLSPERLARSFEYYLWLKNGDEDVPGLTGISLRDPMSYPVPKHRNSDLTKAFDDFFKEIKTRRGVRDDGTYVTEMYTGANPANAPSDRRDHKHE